MTHPSHKIKESCEFCADLVCGMEAYVYLGTLVESKIKVGPKIKECSELEAKIKESYVWGATMDLCTTVELKIEESCEFCADLIRRGASKICAHPWNQRSKSLRSYLWGCRSILVKEPSEDQRAIRGLMNHQSHHHQFNQSMLKIKDPLAEWIDLVVSHVMKEVHITTRSERVFGNATDLPKQKTYQSC